MAPRLPAHVHLYTARDALRAALDAWEREGRTGADVAAAHALLRQLDVLRLRELDRRRGHRRAPRPPAP